MRDDDILGWVRDERLSLADFLDGLDEHEWRMDSLCQGWTVHDVAAHLTLSTRTTVRMVLTAGPVAELLMAGTGRAAAVQRIGAAR